MAFGKVVAVVEQSVGTTLAVDATAGDTVITVDDVSKLAWPAGGLQIGDETTNERRVYTVADAPDEDIDVIDDEENVDTAEGTVSLFDTVGAPLALANSYEVDTPVVQFPDVTEKIATVLLPDQDEELHLRVPQQLADRLPADIRVDELGTSGTSETVELEESDNEYVIADVVDKSSVQDLNSVLITTDPDQTGERVDIDFDGIREYEDDGTTVGVSLTQGEGLDLLGDVDEATNATRMVRWLLANGDVLAYLSASENTSLSPDFDSLVLRITAQSVSNRAGLGLYATDGSGNDAGFNIRTGGAFNGEVYAVSAAAAKLLIDDLGVSEYAFADGSNLGTGWANWTPTLTGWSADPTNSVYRYKQIGKLVVASIRQATAGTSNATTKTISAPVAAATITNMVWAETCAAQDNGSDLTTSSQVSISSGSSTINFAKDLSTLTGGWTATGGHKIKYCTLIYEAA